MDENRKVRCPVCGSIDNVRPLPGKGRRGPYHISQFFCAGCDFEIHDNFNTDIITAYYVRTDGGLVKRRCVILLKCTHS